MGAIWIILLFLMNILLIVANGMMLSFHIEHGNTALAFVSGGATLICVGAAIFNVATLINMERRK